MDVDLFNEFDFSEFTQIILLLESATSALSEVLFEGSLTNVLWVFTIDEFFN